MTLVLTRSQYKPEMDLVNDRINTVNNRNSTALNRSDAGPVDTTPSTNRDNMLSKTGNTRRKASKVLIHALTIIAYTRADSTTFKE